MMQYIAEIKNLIISLLRYLHRNAWTIIFILAGGYFLFDNCEFCQVSFAFLPFSHHVLLQFMILYVLPFSIATISYHLILISCVVANKNSHPSINPPISDQTILQTSDRPKQSCCALTRYETCACQTTTNC